MGQSFEHPGRHAGVAAHADADDGEFADLFVGNDFFEAGVFLDPVEDFACLEQIGFVESEADIGRAAGAVAGALDDHVHVDRVVADRLEDAGGRAGFVGDMGQGDFGLVPVERDAADDDALHIGGFFFHKGAGVVIEAGTDGEADTELLGELDGAALHDFGAEAGQFQHFVVRDLVQLPGGGNDARIGRVDAVHVGVDLAQVGLESGGQSDGREGGTTAAERRDLPFGSLPLEAGHDDHVAAIEHLMNLLGGDVGDLGLGMDAVRVDAGLRSGQGNRRNVEGMQGHGGQGDGGLFAGGQENVHFSFAGQRHDLLGQLDQAVGHTAHGGDDHDDLIAFGAMTGNAGGDIFDPIGVADGGATIFLNDQGHAAVTRSTNQRAPTLPKAREEGKGPNPVGTTANHRKPPDREGESPLSE